MSKSLLFCVIGLLSVVGCSRENSAKSDASEQLAPAVPSAPSTPQPSPVAAIPADQMLNGKHYPDLPKYYEYMRAKQYSDARNLASLVLGASDPNIQPLLAEAEIKYYLQVVADPKASKDEKKEALLGLRDYPEQAKQFQREISKIEQGIERAKRNAWDAEAERKFATKAKSEGVRLGMTTDEVLMSSWGRPQRRSTTTTSDIVHEHWYYGGLNSLMFENGRLVVISN